MVRVESLYQVLWGWGEGEGEGLCPPQLWPGEQ